MNYSTTKMLGAMTHTLATLSVLGSLLLSGAVNAAVPGITGGTGTPAFNLTASASNISQPDGAVIYAWGYGCTGVPGGFVPTNAAANCPLMQMPGPTMIVTQGDVVTVNLTNGLPAAAGNTSIVFPGFNVSSNLPSTTSNVAYTIASPYTLSQAAANTVVVDNGVVFDATAISPGTALVAVPGSPGTGQYSFANGVYTFSSADAGQPVVINSTATTTSGVVGLLTREAESGSTVTYTFTASKPGTYAYYSGTQSDLQIEMGLFGAIVVLPNSTSASTANCVKTTPYTDAVYSLAKSAYDNPNSCYDREYLFQFSEISSAIHDQVKAQVDACGTAPTTPCPQILANMEPYRPNYYLINGRSMPDDMDISYSPAYPNQPYNGNPHMHPGELVLMRVIGQGHWQHPFHFHGNHARVLARDANMLLSQTTGSTNLAGPLLFTIATVSGQTVDAIFTWTGQGLNWDAYGLDPSGHTCNTKAAFDSNGQNIFTKPASNYDPTSTGFDPVTHEYCLDHGKPIPATPPDPSIVVNGQWYGGTPYIGLQSANTTPEAPGTLNQNPQAGYAYMWHSHNEREITTNDVFPGGMMMMLLIDPSSWTIDETQ